MNNTTNPPYPSPGAARCPGPSTRDLILRDADDAPEALTTEAYTFLGDQDIPFARYTSRIFARVSSREGAAFATIRSL